MKKTRFEIFKDMLRKEGFQLSCNWEQKIHFGNLESWSIQNKGTKNITVLIAIYNRNNIDNGFDIYLPDNTNNMDKSIEIIKKSMK